MATLLLSFRCEPINAMMQKWVESLSHLVMEALQLK